MSRGVDDRAARLRRCRETFTFALANGLTMADATREIARRRLAEIDARLEAKKRCGTVITSPVVARDYWWTRD